MQFSQFQADIYPEIEQLYIDVFSASEGEEEGQSIGDLVHALLTETAENDIYRFGAKEDGDVLAAILFTRLTFNKPVNAFILSPVAVHTDHQRKGVGQALINYGLEYLKSNGVSLVFTYGDPSYYSKLGFQSITEELIRAPQKMSMPQGWLCQSLEGKAIERIEGPSQCMPALAQPEYW